MYFHARIDPNSEDIRVDVDDYTYLIYRNHPLAAEIISQLISIKNKLTEERSYDPTISDVTWFKTSELRERSKDMSESLGDMFMIVTE